MVGASGNGTESGVRQLNHGQGHGIITVSYTHLDVYKRQEFGGEKMTGALRKKAEDLLRGEVAEYDAYLRGECYGFELYKNGELSDSCWGFIGSLEDACKAIADYRPDECKGMTLSLIHI